MQKTKQKYQTFTFQTPPLMQNFLASQNPALVILTQS